MATPEHRPALIDDAFNKLNQSISEQDARNFRSTVLEDVWTAAREIEDTQRKGQVAQNLRRIEPFLEGIGKYSKMIEILCNGTPYLPFIWVSILPSIL
jgi:hypothetical protein